MGQHPSLPWQHPSLSLSLFWPKENFWPKKRKFLAKKKFLAKNGEKYAILIDFGDLVGRGEFETPINFCRYTYTFTSLKVHSLSLSLSLSLDFIIPNSQLTRGSPSH